MIGFHSLKSSLICTLRKPISVPTSIISVRHGQQMRGKPPGIARTLEQRLEELKKVPFEIEKKPVDIGFPAARLSKKQEKIEKAQHYQRQKNDREFERLARTAQLYVDLDDVSKEWRQYNGQFQIKSIATHYGIYEHLFGYAYFVPRIPLDIKFKISDDEYAPVYYGNTLKPTQVKNEPEVTFDASTQLLDNETKKETFWTLLLTNPDCHFQDSTKEYVHWFVANIPNGNVTKGDVIVPYLQPFPPRGTGYHRHIFVLYKQEKKLNFDDYKVNEINDLDKRTFTTLDFYRKYQDDITPAGLSFFQSDWDKNVTDLYHNVLKMKEPIFEYDFPQPYIKREDYFPLGEAFNLYLDRHRDEKQINKEYLERAFKKTHPFDGPEPPLRYPNAHSMPNSIPSWLVNEKKKSRLGWGRINEIKAEHR